MSNKRIYYRLESSYTTTNVCSLPYYINRFWRHEVDWTGSWRSARVFYVTAGTKHVRVHNTEFLYKVKQDRHCTCKRNIQPRSLNHCCRWKAISIIYSACVSVALVIQHGKGMRCIILITVACLRLPYFSTSFHKQHNFRKKSYWII